MDVENVVSIVLRLVHIVFGVFWAGSAMFLAFILEPRGHVPSSGVRVRHRVDVV